MKKLLLLLLLAGSAYADGPLSRFKDSDTDQEFVNIYQDIRNPNIVAGIAQKMTISTGVFTSVRISTITLVSSATITNLTVTNINGAAYSVGKIVQMVSAVTSTLFSTTSTAFTSTGLAASITPTSASNKVLVLVSGHYRYSGATLGNPSYWTLDRGGTNLGSATNGLGRVQNLILNTAGDTELLAGLVYTDSPATTSARTYTVQIRVDASGTVYFPNAGTCSMVLFEVAP